jgi:hypothetical protein
MLRKNSESWRVDPTCQISKEICSSSARASNEWQLFRGPTPARPGSRHRQRLAERSEAALALRLVVAPGRRYLTAMFDNQKQFRERLGDDLQWKNRRPILCDQIAITTGRWRASYENWLVNSVSPTRVERYLILSRDANKGVIAYTPEAPLAPAEIIAVRPAPDRLSRADQSGVSPSGNTPHIASASHSIALRHPVI